jgi:hypothetical protein
VLASLGSAKSSGNDAKIFSQVAATRNAAELYAVSHNNSYGSADGNCSTASLFTDSASGMASLVALSNYPSGAARFCFFIASLNEWAFRIDYNGNHFCADSTGAATSSPTVQAIQTDANCDINGTTP